MPLPPQTPWPNMQKHYTHAHTNSCVCAAKCRKAAQEADCWSVVCAVKPNPSHPASPCCDPVRAPNHILMYGQASRGESSWLWRVWVERFDHAAPSRFSSPQVCTVTTQGSCRFRPPPPLLVPGHQGLLIKPRREGPLNLANCLIYETPEWQ